MGGAAGGRRQARPAQGGQYSRQAHFLATFRRTATDDEAWWLFYRLVFFSLSRGTPTASADDPAPIRTYLQTRLAETCPTLRSDPH